MPAARKEASIGEIASDLLEQKKQGRPVVLFLGARAGGFFGNADFYAIIKEFSLLNFDELSEGAKFQECYRVLNSKRLDGENRFAKDDIDEILMRSLNNLYYREENEPLARPPPL